MVKLSIIILKVLLLNRVSTEYIFNIKISTYAETGDNQLPPN